jgi:hypothetical protein
MLHEPRHEPSVDVTGDALLPLAGWLLAMVALMVLAAPAAGGAGLLYAAAAWRRWRWQPLALAGAAGVVLALAVFGPAGALHRQLLVVRDVSDAHAFLGVVIKRRWTAWVTAQLPLTFPLAALVAAAGRWQATRDGEPAAV